MNATKWETLTDFVKFLGKEGHCIVDQTEKGWFIQYVDRDPAVLARQAQLEKRGKAELDEAERQAKIIEEMIRKDREKVMSKGVDLDVSGPSAMIRSDPNETINFTMKTIDEKGSTVEPTGLSFIDQVKASIDLTKSAGVTESRQNGKRKKSQLELIVEEEEARKQLKLNKEQARAAATGRKDYWLVEGIVVKILNKTLSDGKYYKRKCLVKTVIDR